MESDESEFVLLRNIELGFYAIGAYIRNIVNRTTLSDEELDLANHIRKYQLGDERINYLDVISSFGCKAYFQNFYNVFVSASHEEITFFQSRNLKHNEYYFSILRAKILGLVQIKFEKSKNARVLEKFSDIEKAHQKWFLSLQKAYEATYKHIFDNERYRYNVKAVYKLGQLQLDDYTVTSKIEVVYENEKLVIEEFTETYDKLKGSFNRNDNLHKTGYLKISSGIGYDNFFDNNRPIFDATRCLLYQGIAKKLDIECVGIGVGYTRSTLFYHK